MDGFEMKRNEGLTLNNNTKKKKFHKKRIKITFKVRKQFDLNAWLILPMGEMERI